MELNKEGKTMVVKEFTQEQLAMLADCILAKMQDWREIGDKVQSRELTELVRTKSAELMTMFNYINADREE